MKAQAPLVDALTRAIAPLRAIGPSSVVLRPIAGGQVNDAFHVRAEAFEAFVKTRQGAPSGSFEAEAQGLERLRPFVRTPRPLAVSSAPPFLVLEFLPMAPCGDDEALGRAIARMHGARIERASLPAEVWIGPIALPNTIVGGDTSFFRLRIAPLLDAAPQGLALDARRRDALERAFARRLEGRPTDRLLHGDLWSGNVAFLSDGTPVLFDCAVGAGDPEVDLAMMNLFGGFSSRVWRAYREASPEEPGEAERRTCYELFPLLVHHALFGGSYTTACRTRTARLLADG